MCLQRWFRSLLITAFIATLILDMGAGPVFIVFGSVHLGKPSPFPASVWLMVMPLFLWSCAGAGYFKLRSVCDGDEHVLDCVPFEDDLLAKGAENVAYESFCNVGSSSAFC